MGGNLSKVLKMITGGKRYDYAVIVGIRKQLLTIHSLMAVFEEIENSAIEGFSFCTRCNGIEEVWRFATREHSACFCKRGESGGYFMTRFICDLYYGKCLRCHPSAK